MRKVSIILREKVVNYLSYKLSISINDIMTYLSITDTLYKPLFFNISKKENDFIGHV